MKTALITTTINVPRVLELYRKLDSEVRFFVALDQKTPEEAVNFLRYDLSNTHCVFIQEQQQYEHSELIGWNTVARRNIALLEALKWGAELIVTIDDDNIPLRQEYFWDFQKLLDNQWAWHGLQIGDYLLDPGQLSFPTDGIDSVVQRGFPQSSLTSIRPVEPITNAKIGVAQGVILGDPDTSAVDRISRHPQVHQVSELLRAGVVVSQKAYTVFNTQNTAFLRELAPAMFCNPHFGRYDDIYASLITQRIMKERDLYVHLGQPFVWQERNDHDLLKDLAAEQWGAEHIIELINYLRRAPLPDASVTDQCRVLTEGCAIFSDEMKACARAWYNDVEKVL